MGLPGAIPGTRARNSKSALSKRFCRGENDFKMYGSVGHLGACTSSPIPRGRVGDRDDKAGKSGASPRARPCRPRETAVNPNAIKARASTA